MVPMMKDSRGRESTTLSLVIAAYLPVWVKYAFAGFTLPVVGAVPPMTATEFATSIGLILAIWLGREWTEKRSAQ